MELAMSRDVREKFLAEARVGVLAVPEPPAVLQVPVWYAYEPGGPVVVLTARASRKAALIRAAGRFGLCVQDENPPYRYVSVEGPAAVEDRVDPAELSAMAHRYLDPATAREYLAANRGQLTDDITFRMRPQRWRTADFAAFAQQFS
ncbi:pyridoxamine 5'-phosphate oxidase family protein [Crossiella sp. NPDC003009]